MDPAAIIVGGGLAVTASAIAGTSGILNALPLLMGAGAGFGALGLGTTRAKAGAEGFVKVHIFANTTLLYMSL